ncbi:MAG: lipid-A-disaccharide synthase [Paludibacteraceae bacterium]
MKYFIIAGEASGDLHGSNLMAALKHHDAEAQFCFLGGDLMAAQGGRQVKHYRDMAFMGITAVVRHLPTVLRNMRDTRRAIVQFQPDVVILIDYPSFNLQIAKYVKTHFDTPVYYYISPKLWAWKTYRIKSIKKYIDKMFTIFPFETAFYAQFDYAVEYVGNPTVDAIATHHALSHTADFRATHHLDKRPIVAVLAGSRRQEIVTTLPTVMPLADRFPNFQFVLAAAPSADTKLYQSYVSDNVKIVHNCTYDLLDHAYAAIVNSGTATLETGLFGVPQIVVYHVPGGRIGTWLKRLLIKTKFVSLVNLVAEKEVVRELVAHEFTTNNVCAELTRLLTDTDYYQHMQTDYAALAQRLGGAGAAENAAQKIVNLLTNNNKCNV